MKNELLEWLAERSEHARERHNRYNKLAAAHDSDRTLYLGMQLEQSVRMNAFDDVMRYIKELEKDEKGSGKEMRSM